MKNRKIWLGVGVATALGASFDSHPAAAASAQSVAAALRSTASGALLRVADDGASDAHKMHGADGGEGGEGGEGRRVQLDPAVQFYSYIELIRGHLLVGDELVKAERWADALPHFLHPSEEIYGEIRDTLENYGTAAFEAEMKALVQTVKAKDADAYAAALTAVLGKMAAADAGVKKGGADFTALAVKSSLEILRTATEEYNAAIKDGKITEAVEYQDSRGFVWQASLRIESIAADLEKRAPDALTSTRQALAMLKKAWPSAVPPDEPVMNAGAVISAVSRVELALSGVK